VGQTGPAWNTMRPKSASTMMKSSVLQIGGAGTLPAIMARNISMPARPPTCSRVTTPQSWLVASISLCRACHAGN